MNERDHYQRDPHGHLHDMNLPEGVNCGDCTRFKKCETLFSHQIKDEKCDFAPHRFELNLNKEL